jgi:fumarate hydratase class II
MTRPGVRVEHDSMGEVEVPADALWGAQTQRAVDNFPVSGERIGRDLIGALGAIKGAAARVNAELGVIDAEMAGASTTRRSLWTCSRPVPAPRAT